MSDPRASLPAVEVVLSHDAVTEVLSVWPRTLVTDEVRAVLAAFRERVESGASPPSPDEVALAVVSRMRTLDRRRLQPVINASGVLLHTNLGRAPLGEEVAKRALEIAASYCSLEYDLPSGRRGGRAGLCHQLLATLSGAEDALVVCNNASAVLLTLAALASGGEVIVSRGELIEIGGGFRIPEVLALSGAVMVEVGTTNRTRADDYESAITERTAAILSVHRSNFRMEGFVESPSVSDLADLASGSGVPLVVDVGLGAVFDTATFGLPHEPVPGDLIAQGASVVCCSGDKLFGGIQAGLIVGSGAEIARVRRHPFHRAVRADKLTLAIIEQVALAHMRGDTDALPLVAMLRTTTEELRVRAERIAEAIPDGFEAEVATMSSTTGGGTLPGADFESVGLKLSGWRAGADDLAAMLRDGVPPIVARVEDDAVWLDLRTVFPSQDKALVERINSLS